MLPSAFTAKIGPLPAWAWGLIVGAGVLGFTVLRHRGTAAADQAAADATDPSNPQVTGSDAGTPSDVMPVADGAGDSPGWPGPIGGVGGTPYTPPYPADMRMDPEQWKLIQAQLAAIRKWQRNHSHHKAPKGKKKHATPATIPAPGSGPRRVVGGTRQQVHVVNAGRPVTGQVA